MNVFAARAAELIQDRPELTAAIIPLLKTREVIERQIADLDRKVLRLARNNTQVRRFMTVPGVWGRSLRCAISQRSMIRLGSRNRAASALMPD